MALSVEMPINLTYSEEDAITDEASDTASLEDFPESLLCFLLSFLHGFSIAGQCPVTCRSLAAASSHERLCAHLVERDFAQEFEAPLPQQPRRPRLADVSSIETFWRCHLGLQAALASDFFEGKSSIGIRNTSSGSARELRAMAKTLGGKGAQHIANVAAHDGRPSLLLWAAQRASLSNVDGSGRSALVVAAANNRPQTVRAASMFCNLEQKNGKFGTALHMAAYRGAAEAVQELCACWADLESRNATYLQTPLLVACSRNHAMVVSILLDAGADRNARDRDGLTASRICASMHSHRAAETMQESVEQHT